MGLGESDSFFDESAENAGFCGVRFLDWRLSRATSRQIQNWCETMDLCRMLKGMSKRIAVSFGILSCVALSSCFAVHAQTNAAAPQNGTKDAIYFGAVATEQTETNEYT